MKILILHRTENIIQSRLSALNFAFCTLKNAHNNDYCLHCVTDVSSKELQKEEFDVIILDTSFLWERFNYNNKDLFIKKYSFLKNSSALKIAFPQDDYSLTGILDECFSEWDVDIVFSINSRYRNVLYPSLGDNVQFYKSFAGYVDNSDILEIEKHSLPFDRREIDVGYRSKDHQYTIGSFGLLKATMTEKFSQALKDINSNHLNIDLSNDINKTLYGNSWYKFLGNSKFTLGCEGGSSLIDRYGKTREKIQTYIKQFPKASYKEVEENCFPGEDSQYIFNTISPRIFEAAMAYSCQILIEGEYEGIMSPWMHYIPLKEDYSNIKEVVEFMQQTDKVLEMIDNCYNELIKSGKYNYQSFVKKIFDSIEKHPKKQKPVHPLTDCLSNNELKEILIISNYISNKKGYASVSEIKEMSTVQKKKLLLLSNLKEYIESKFQ